MPFLPVVPSVDAVQNLNATGTVTAWGSVALIGVSPLTANITVTLPAVGANIGKTIRFVRVDSTAFTVTLAAGAGDVLTLRSAGGELNTQSGSVTVQAVASATARQVAQVAALPTQAHTISTKAANYTTSSADFGSYLRFTGGVPTLHAPTLVDVGRSLTIRNATGAQFTVGAGGATVSGSLVVPPDKILVLLVVGAGAFDVIGGS